MGDPQRFNVFAAFLAHHVKTQCRIADIAGGSGMLQVCLRKHGFQHVETFDRRSKHRRTSGMQYHRKRFDIPRGQGFGLFVGLHPDEATDVIIETAIRYQRPFMLVPCCVKPCLVPYHGPRYYTRWLVHLEMYAQQHRYQVTRHMLRMRGCNIVLWGTP